MAISPSSQKKLYAEADARFAAQTGITRKLDPKKKIDQQLIPVWIDIYGKVRDQFLAGVLVFTYDHPFVAPALAAADRAADRAAASMNAAAIAASPPPAGVVVTPAEQHAAVAAHVAEAHAAHVEAQQALASAAAQQPPTVSHAHVRHAAHAVQQFVMNGAGMGVPVIANGADAATIMQVQAAPGNAAAIDQGAGAPAPSLPPAGLPLPDFTTLPRPHVPTSGKGYLIGVAVLGAAALATWGIAKHSERRHPRARRRLPDGRLYTDLPSMDPRRRLA